MSFVSDNDTSFASMFYNMNSFLKQAKALAEKNERDLQVQREQAERNVSFVTRVIQFDFFTCGFFPFLSYVVPNLKSCCFVEIHKFGASCSQ